MVQFYPRWCDGVMGVINFNFTSCKKNMIKRYDLG